MTSDGQLPIVIVGGGAAGTLVAVNLLRRSAARPVVMIERGPRVSRGVAYGTAFPDHLLNVVAANMGGLAGDPNHFRTWLASRGTPARATSFMPRSTFGDYLQHLLDGAVLQAQTGAFELVRGEVVGVAAGEAGSIVRLADGGSLEAAAVVLATGVLPPRDAPLADGGWPHDSPLYAADPWAEGALERLAPGDDLLLVGSGLTMVDIALRLIDLRPQARLESVSRTGLLPQPHRWPGQRHPLADFRLPPPGTPLRALRAAFDRASAASYAQGGDWRDAINAVRPYTQDIWKGLSLDEQRRFLHTYRRYWDIHRHRMAPAVAAWVGSLRDDGQLRAGAGLIERVAEVRGRLQVSIRRRDGLLDERAFAAAVNCTGPAGSVVGAGSPLYDSLLSAGLVRPHPLGLGLDTAATGALYDESGTISTTLFTLGWLRRGELWESVAIPEIRAQAADIAFRLTVRPRSSASTPAPSAERDL